MDPALLHQRLDLLLKSSSCSSSSSISSTAQQAPLPPRRSTLDSIIRFGGEVDTAANERFRVGRHPARTTTTATSGSSDVLSCQRQAKIRSSSRILIQSRSLQQHHHDSSAATSTTTESSSLSGSTSTSTTAALHSLAVDPSTTTLRTCTANSISSTPELKPATPRHSAPPHPLPQSAAVKVSAMKKTRILNRIRRSASITFDLPPGGIVSSQQQQQQQDTTMVSSSSTTIDTTTAVAPAAPSMTQPLHLVEQQHQLPASTTATATVVATTTVATTPLGLKSTSQRPHPVTPRQSASTISTTSSSKKRKSNRPFPHLTLSSHKRPNQMVRLTDADPTRSLEQEYDLKGPGCKVIGHGAFSTVRSALCRRQSICGSSGDDDDDDDDTAVMVAIKSISKFDAMKARRLRRPGSKHMDEWEIMKLLQDNPYTLSLLDLLETDEEIHLVTEYCAGGELFNAIKRKGISRCSFRKGRFSEQQASRITHQLLKALEEMHQHGIVHRDIKPENVLLLKTEDETSQDDIPVKLADFGVARVHHHHHDDSYAGRGLEAVSETASSDGDSSPSTPGLLLADKVDPPPEGCRGTCGPASDMFSLGVTLYILLCGFPPVFCENVVHFPDAYWDDISADAKDLVRSMLRKDPEQRITAADALHHVWIRQEQAPRGRRGSMCANLELVRSQLAKTLQGTASATTTAPVASSLANSNGKRSLRNSIHYTSPKRAKRHVIQLPMTELFNCQQQEKRDARVTKEPPIEASAIGREAAADGVKVACN